MRKIKRFLCMTLAMLMALSAMSLTASATLEGENEYVWLNPEAEAYYNTMGSAASRSWYIAIASANGDYVVKGGLSDLTGVSDSDKVRYRSGEWSISLGGIADDGFASNDFLAKVELGGSYFGRNAFRNSALTDLTFDHMHTEGVQSSRGYFRARADYQQICWGRSGVIFEDYAFADCKNLTSVVFASEPKDLYLAPTAFTGCPNLTITAPAGGLIEAHCKANGINFIGYGTIERQPHAYEYLEPFTDILSTDEPAEAVAWAVENGITTGTSATTFSPCGFVTRAETVTFLWRMAGSPKAGNVDNPFTDVSSGTWYYDAVMWAVKNGVTNGTSATTFSPNTRVNRAQVIQFLYNYAGKPELVSSSAPHIYNINNHYGSEEGSWYYKAACWAYQNKMLVDSTRFFPNAPCQRALMVQYLYNYFKSDPNALKNPGGGEITYIGPFIDVTTDSPYADAIRWAYEQGLTQDVQDFDTTNGIGQDTRGPKFYPDEKLKDVQFAQIMYNRAGRPTVTNQSEIEEKGVMQGRYWTDMWGTTTYYKTHWWFIDALCWTINENYGLFKLGTDGSYTYTSSCSYKKVVTVLYEQAGKPDITGMENPFLYPVYYRAEDYPAVWAYNMGLITQEEARSQNTVCPRGRLFQILYTLDNKPTM